MEDKPKVLTDITGIAELTKELRQFLFNIFGPWSEEVGQELGDHRRLRRHRKNLDRVLEEARKILEELGIEAQVVAPKLLVPVFENAVLEDDEDLQLRWAGLLATAAAGSEVSPAYPMILAQLSGGEAKALDALAKPEMFGHSSQLVNQGVISREEPLRRYLEHLMGLGLIRDDSDSSIDRLRDAIDAEYHRVVQDGTHGVHDVLKGLKRSLDRPRSRGVERASLTEMGKDFVQVCRGPEKKATPGSA